MNDDMTNIASIGLSIIRVAGEDRASFLHSFCTADIKQLATDQFCEAFFLNHKGKTVCHGLVIARELDILIVSTATQPSVLLANLDKYLLTADVQLSDHTHLWNKAFVFGPNVEQALEACQITMPKGTAVHNLGFRLVLCAELAGPGVLVLDPADADSSLVEELTSNGAVEISEEDFHRARIAKQTPWCDTEVNEDCLPQEFRRDDKAISFTKGCYLGQETVARLDALGHVNRYFVGFEVVDGAVAVGDDLRSDGKKVGRVTSLAEVPGGKTIGLGFLRVELTSPDNEVDCETAKILVR